MSDHQDLVSKLITRNQIDFLTDMFLYLETKSIIKCLRVKPVWKTFLLKYIFKYQPVGLKLISKAWREFNPDYGVHTLTGSITDLSGDDEKDVYMASYIHGDGDFVMEDGTRSIVGGDLQSDDCLRHVTTSRVQMGEHIISISKYGIDKNARYSMEIIIKSRSNLKTIYRYKGKNRNSMCSCYILERSAFIIDGDLLKLITFNSSCDVFQENDKDLFDGHTNFEHKHMLGELQLVHEKFLVFADKCIPFLLHILDHSRDTWRAITIYNEADNTAGPLGVLNVSKVWPHLIILLRNSLFVIKDCVHDNTKSQLRHLGVCSGQNDFVSMRSNNNIVAVIDQRNLVHLFSIKDLLAVDSAPLVSPYARLELPLPLCQYSLPCLALTSASLLAASKGSNRLLRYTVWDDMSWQ